MRIEGAQALELRPDDFLIVSLQDRVDFETAWRVCQQMSETFGHRSDRVVIVDRGAAFTVLRKVKEIDADEA